MTWKVRHQGSPQSVEGLTLAQVVEGLQDGLWEPTDEVMGPDEAEWVAIENHPLLAEIAAEIEPPPPREYDDETRLDMNPLIDVCLVLLVFFILTTSYAALQLRLKLDDTTTAKAGTVVITDKQVKEQMIHVVVKMEDGKPVFRVEGKVVAEDHLVAELFSYHRDNARTDLLLEHDGDVPHGAVVAVMDAAKGARLERIRLLVP
ncbi:MAG TPA: biopolymer transporter ExbD [Gemmataceae bacterium]|nr:biopolymer transporter ExbD [Gemmataceae bacterium]